MSRKQSMQNAANTYRSYLFIYIYIFMYKLCPVKIIEYSSVATSHNSHYVNIRARFMCLTSRSSFMCVCV